MATSRFTREELMDRGSGRPAPEGVVRLYHQAFEAYATRALWNWRLLEQPTVTQVLSTAESLRTEGDIVARRLAERLEEACRVAL